MLNLDIVPPHIHNSFSYSNEFYDYKCSIRLRKNAHRFFRGLLKLEISDTYKKIRVQKRTILDVTKSLHGYLPVNILNKCFNTQYISLDRFVNVQFSLVNKKIDRCKRDVAIHEINAIEPISYHINNSDKQNYSSVKSSSLRNDSTHVFIKANTFSNQSAVSLFDIRNGWFVNLSSCDIPDKVVELLQLGDNFSMPNINNHGLFEVIKDFENNLRFFDKK